MTRRFHTPLRATGLVQTCQCHRRLTEIKLGIRDDGCLSQGLACLDDCSLLESYTPLERDKFTKLRDNTKILAATAYPADYPLNVTAFTAASHSIFVTMSPS